MRAFLKTQPKTEEDIKCSKDCMIRSVAISTNKGVLKLLRDVYNKNPNDIKIKWNFYDSII